MLLYCCFVRTHIDLKAFIFVWYNVAFITIDLGELNLEKV
jgi:hypothetical protein